MAAIGLAGPGAAERYASIGLIVTVSNLAVITFLLAGLDMRTIHLSYDSNR